MATMYSGTSAAKLREKKVKTSSASGTSNGSDSKSGSNAPAKFGSYTVDEAKAALSKGSSVDSQKQAEGYAKLKAESIVKGGGKSAYNINEQDRYYLEQSKEGKALLAAAEKANPNVVAKTAYNPLVGKTLKEAGMSTTAVRNAGLGVTREGRIVQVQSIVTLSDGRVITQNPKSGYYNEQGVQVDSNNRPITDPFFGSAKTSLTYAEYQKEQAMKQLFGSVTVGEAKNTLEASKEENLEKKAEQKITFEAFQEASKEAQEKALATGQPVSVGTSQIVEKSIELASGKYAEGVQVADAKAASEVLNANYAVLKANQAIEAANKGESSAFRLTPTDTKALEQFGVPDAGNLQAQIDNTLQVNKASTFASKETVETEAESLVKTVDKPTEGPLGPVIDFGKGALAVGENLANTVVAGGSILSKAPFLLNPATYDQARYEMDYELARLQEKYKSEPEGDLMGLGVKAAIDMATTGKTDVSTSDLEKIGENIQENPAYATGALTATALTWLIGAGEVKAGIKAAGKVGEAAGRKASLKVAETALSGLEAAKAEKGISKVESLMPIKPTPSFKNESVILGNNVIVKVKPSQFEKVSIDLGTGSTKSSGGGVSDMVKKQSPKSSPKPDTKEIESGSQSLIILEKQDIVKQSASKSKFKNKTIPLSISEKAEGEVFSVKLKVEEPPRVKVKPEQEKVGILSGIIPKEEQLSVTAKTLGLGDSTKIAQERLATVKVKQKERQDAALIPKLETPHNMLLDIAVKQKQQQTRKTAQAPVQIPKQKQATDIVQVPGFATVRTPLEGLTFRLDTPLVPVNVPLIPGITVPPPSIPPPTRRVPPIIPPLKRLYGIDGLGSRKVGDTSIVQIGVKNPFGGSLSTGQYAKKGLNPLFKKKKGRKSLL